MWEVGDGSEVVAFAGDWHGQIAGIEEKLVRLADAGVTRVLHVGDFAIWPDRGGRVFLDRVDALADAADIRIAVTPGNHEDWDFLTKAFAAAGEGNPALIRPNIAALPRGFRWTHQQRNFVSLGGAASIDYQLRRVNHDWWVDEVPTEADVERVSLGGFAEIMVLHDSPDPGTASVNMIREYRSGWPADARRYARAGARRITEAWQAVQPTLTVHGHFHVRGEITLPTGQRIVSLAEETTAGNVLLLNLHTLETTWLENLQ